MDLWIRCTRTLPVHRMQAVEKHVTAADFRIPKTQRVVRDDTSLLKRNSLPPQSSIDNQSHHSSTCADGISSHLISSSQPTFPSFTLPFSPPLSLLWNWPH